MHRLAALWYREGYPLASRKNVFMSNVVTFETPENIEVAYRIAGPGTRYIAFVIDALLLAVGYLVVLLFFGAVFIATQSLGGVAQETLGIIAIVVVVIAAGFALIGYFALFEMFMGGQTPGKRLMRIRVVNAAGFSLGAGPVLIRSIFRIVDVIPPLWVVPLLSEKVQRFGDMVAGTLVVSEDTPHLSAVRERYAARDVSARQFTFTGPQIAAMRPVDVDAVELFLERRDLLHPEHRHSVCEKIVRGLSSRLGVDPPGVMERDAFLDDLFASYLTWEARQLA
jgi:uncharacterized RDD family membrane protein YckC